MPFNRCRIQFALIGLFFLAGCAEETPLSQTIVQFDGVEFPVPKDWTNVKSEQLKTKAFLVHQRASKKAEPAKMSKNVNGVLMVDVGQPTRPTAEETAKAFDGSEGVKILIDGAEAVRIETTSNNLSKPRHVAVVYRDGKVYLIMASGSGALDVTDAFNQVLATWKWTK
jgi:hypothetical protein